MRRPLAAVMIVATLGALGCRTPVTEEPGAAPGPEPEAASAQANHSGAEIDCDELLPSALREEFQPGRTVTLEPMCPGCPLHCRFHQPGKQPVSVMYDCRASFTEDEIEETRENLEEHGLERLDGVGRTALVGPNLAMVWAGDVDCLMTITWFGAGDDLALFTAAAAKHLTASAVGR